MAVRKKMFFKPVKIKERVISKNNGLNLTKLGYFMQFVSKMTQSRLKMDIYELQISVVTL